MLFKAFNINVLRNFHSSQHFLSGSSVYALINKSKSEGSDRNILAYRGESRHSQHPYWRRSDFLTAH